jgi:hypothetical protein
MGYGCVCGGRRYDAMVLEAREPPIPPNSNIRARTNSLYRPFDDKIPCTQNASPSIRPFCIRLGF